MQYNFKHVKLSQYITNETLYIQRSMERVPLRDQEKDFFSLALLLICKLS
jgi:hypothetical protein